MADNQEKTINHYGQLFLLLLATTFGFTRLGLFSMVLLYILPILGIWQLIDFALLWSANGYKKWYSFYICTILAFILFGIFISYSSDNDDDNNNAGNLGSMIGLACYTITIGWVYLLYWRKK